MTINAQYTTTTPAFSLFATPATGSALPDTDPSALGNRPLAVTLQAETHDIRFTTDGTAPTASVGTLLVAGAAPWTYAGPLSQLRFIQTANGAKLNVVYTDPTATIGPQGYQGAMGNTGSQGAQGAQGATGGGGSSGAPRIYGPIVINFDDAGLVAGKDIYTPTVGDVLLELWIEKITAWDGTTPRLDFGTFVGSTTGFFAYSNAQAIMDGSVNNEPFGAGLLINSDSSVWRYSTFSPPDYGGVSPGRFTATNPLKICVSTTGATDGSDPGAMQGVAHVYLVVATPVAP